MLSTYHLHQFAFIRPHLMNMYESSLYFIFRINESFYIRFVSKQDALYFIGSKVEDRNIVIESGSIRIGKNWKSIGNQHNCHLSKIIFKWVQNFWPNRQEILHR